MSKSDDLIEVFEILKKELVKHSKKLDVVYDTDKNYYLNTNHIMKNKKPMFFGAVQIKKSYVSYHLMPVYANPALLKGISPELKKCMQGKTKKGIADYKKEGYI